VDGNCHVFDTSALTSLCFLGPVQNQNPLNGVSTFDLVLIIRHILGIESLDSPYKLLAADANSTGSITAFDIVILRRLILFLDTQLADNTSWQFIPETFVFPNPSNPFSTTIPNVVSWGGSSNSDTCFTFISIKTGDVNGSSTNPFTSDQDSENRSSQNLSLQIDDPMLSAGQTYDIQVRAEAATELLGLQLALSYDQQAIAIEQIMPSGELADMTENNLVHLIDKNLLACSWNSAYPQKLANEAPLFTIRLKALQNGLLSDWLNIDEQYLSAEAYTEDGTKPAGIALHDLQINHQATQTNTAAPNTTLLGAIQPNPANQFVQISFFLPQAQENLQLSLLNTNGQVVKAFRGNYAEGQHQVDWEVGDLPNGLYYYQLQTNDIQISNKMIIQH
ncbi:MAG: T9SS type A sorting domain-containing protein, partial [Bacteroidota bacterium]